MLYTTKVRLDYKVAREREREKERERERIPRIGDARDDLFVSGGQKR